MQYAKIALPLAFASAALANPLVVRDDSCLAAVTGKAAMGDDGLRADDCKSYLATTVTPAAVTVTVTPGAATATITSAPGWEKWKRDGKTSVTVCPNQVPKYASACGNGAAYSSACSAFGYSSAFTTTLTAVTTTVTEGSAAACTAAPSACLDDAKAKYFVDSFVDFLEHTNYNGTQAPKGSGFNTALALQVLAPTFTDTSDSINLLAGYPLGTTTFPNRTAFIYGQGSQPEVQVNVTNIWHSCKSLSFRYKLNTGSPVGLVVTGINVMEVTDDLSQVQTQYAEFNSGAWLADIGNPECKTSSTATAAATPAPSA